MPALFSRHFPQPDLSTVVAPSGGVQPLLLRGNGHRTSKPAQERVTSSIWQAARSHLNLDRPFVFLLLPSFAVPLFRRRSKPYGMQTVRPYVGAVKRVSPYIVSQSWQVGCGPLALAFPQGHISGVPRTKVRWHDGTAPSAFAMVPKVSWPGRSPNFGCRSRHHLGSGRAPALQIRNGKISPVQQGLFNGGTHGYVNVLKNFPGRDSQRAVGGFHKIVASLPAMFTSERIPELQGTGELPGPDQKSRAIDLPVAFCFPHVVPPLGEGRFTGIWLSAKRSFPGWIFCEGEKESTRDRWCGQSPSSVQISNSLREISADTMR